MLLGVTVFLGDDPRSSSDSHCAEPWIYRANFEFVYSACTCGWSVIRDSKEIGEEMMKVHFVLHETFEVPGAYLKWRLGAWPSKVTTTKVYENETLPESVDEIDF